MYKMALKLTYEWKQWMIKKSHELKKMHHLNQDPALKAPSTKPLHWNIDRTIPMFSSFIHWDLTTNQFLHDLEY